MVGDRSDRKLEHVAVARFTYRHEAEFAAGFLDDARIPYRLQIDDPALGMPLSGSVTLWVTAMDEKRARHVLEMEGGAVRDVDDLDDEAYDETGEARAGKAARVDEGAPVGKKAVPPREVPPPVSPTPASMESPRRPKGASTESPRRLSGTSASKLSGRERLLAFGAGVAVWSLSRLDVVATAPGAVEVAVVFGSMGLLLIALSGRAPSALRSILSTLSGDAP